VNSSIHTILLTLLTADGGWLVRAGGTGKMRGRGWDDSTMGPLIGRTGRVEAVYRYGATVLMRFSGTFDTH
jgi:hypothetical protein